MADTNATKSRVCFSCVCIVDNEPVICPRLSHNGHRKVVLALGVASGQCNLPWAIMTNLGHITGPL